MAKIIEKLHKIRKKMELDQIWIRNLTIFFNILSSFSIFKFEKKTPENLSASIALLTQFVLYKS